MSDKTKKVIIQKRFEVIDEIGQGRFGKVIKAKDLELERLVALKFFYPDKSIVSAISREKLEENFVLEAKMLASIDHPHIIPIYDYGKITDGFYLVMKLIEGSHLGNYDIKFTNEQLKKMFFKLSQALDYIHSKDKPILHRDIKPHNIMVDKNVHPYLIDFGMGRPEQLNEKTAVGWNEIFKGSLQYSAPELLELFVTHNLNKNKFPNDVKADCRTDLWSLGATFYRLYTKEFPLKGKEMHEIFQSINDREDIVPPSEYNPSILPEIERIILKLLDYDVDLRYQSAAELIEDLKEVEMGNSQKSILDLPEDRKKTGAVEEDFSGRMTVIDLLVNESQESNLKEDKTNFWVKYKEWGIAAAVVCALFVFTRSPVLDKKIDTISEKDPSVLSIVNTAPTISSPSVEDIQNTVKSDEKPKKDIKSKSDKKIAISSRRPKNINGGTVVWTSGSKNKTSSPGLLSYGNEIKDVILISKVVSQDLKSPLKAELRSSMVINGSRVLPKGTIFYGEADAARSSNRVYMQFSRIHLPNGKKFKFKGMGMMPDGSRGIIAQVSSLQDKKAAKNIGKGLFKTAKSALRSVTPGGFGQEFATGVGEEILDDAGDGVGSQRIPSRILTVEKYSSLVIFVEKTPEK